MREAQLQLAYFGTHHFPGLLGEVEGVGQDVDVGRPLQLVPAVGGDVELDVIALQQGHLGLGVFLPKRKLLVVEADPGGDSSRQRVVLQRQNVGTSSGWPVRRRV